MQPLVGLLKWEKKTNMFNKKIVVVKVGTNVMTNKDKRIVRPVLRRLVAQIAELYERDILTVLVSSGSVIAGREVIGKSNIKDKTQRRQVHSAVGQPRMMRLYYNIFHDFGMKCAQVLPTKRDFNPGEHRENMVSCYEGLLSEGITPIVNEDDATSLTMSMFSDNDELACLVAQLLKADKLIILTDTDGLYTGNPDLESSKLIKEVGIDQNVEKYVVNNKKGEAEGRGGMGSKMAYAQQAAAHNIPTYIVNGKQDNIILNIVDGEAVGTKVSL